MELDLLAGDLDVVVFAAPTWAQAEALCYGLRMGRQAWLHDCRGERLVVVPLRDVPGDLAALLRSVQRWVAAGRNGPLFFDLDGRTYVMDRPGAPSVNALDDLSADLPAALEAVSVPTYLIDPSGVIRWVNPAAEKLVGDVRGRQFTSVVAPEESRRAKEHFARKLAGTERVTDTDVIVIGADGRRVPIEISSVCLTEGDRLVAVFGQIVDVDEPVGRPSLPALTPRQVEVLRHLERGRTTDQISDELNLSRETVRNHVQSLLKALGVHTRLEAVAVARHGRK